ncbi:hypothetical protein Tco_0594727 [Tanacetum coccineum]
MQILHVPLAFTLLRLLQCNIAWGLASAYKLSQRNGKVLVLQHGNENSELLQDEQLEQRFFEISTLFLSIAFTLTRLRGSVELSEVHPGLLRSMQNQHWPPYWVIWFFCTHCDAPRKYTFQDLWQACCLVCTALLGLSITCLMDDLLSLGPKTQIVKITLNYIEIVDLNHTVSHRMELDFHLRKVAPNGKFLYVDFSCWKLDEKLPEGEPMARNSSEANNATGYGESFVVEDFYSTHSTNGST